MDLFSFARVVKFEPLQGVLRTHGVMGSSMYLIFPPARRDLDPLREAHATYSFARISIVRILISGFLRHYGPLQLFLSL